MVFFVPRWREEEEEQRRSCDGKVNTSSSSSSSSFTYSAQATYLHSWIQSKESTLCVEVFQKDTHPRPAQNSAIQATRRSTALFPTAARATTPGQIKHFTTQTTETCEHPLGPSGSSKLRQSSNASFTATSKSSKRSQVGSLATLSGWEMIHRRIMHKSNFHRAPLVN